MITCCQHMQKSFPNNPALLACVQFPWGFSNNQDILTPSIHETARWSLTGHVIKQASYSGSFHGYIPSRCLHLMLIPFNAVVGKYTVCVSWHSSTLALLQIRPVVFKELLITHYASFCKRDGSIFYPQRSFYLAALEIECRAKSLHGASVCKRSLEACQQPGLFYVSNY